MTARPPIMSRTVLQGRSITLSQACQFVHTAMIGYWYQLLGISYLHTRIALRIYRRNSIAQIVA